ncbi:MAG TPA: helix-turn-helix domain-containing protein [Pseudonocardia sp.]|nr:helix-turn-helix domain-containing protein [Pseudonocardia sp.]
MTVLPSELGRERSRIDALAVVAGSREADISTTPPIEPPPEPSTQPAVESAVESSVGPIDTVSVADIAASCGISKMTVYRMVRSDQLPAVRVGGLLRIRRSDAQAVYRKDITVLPANGYPR